MNVGRRRECQTPGAAAAMSKFERANKRSTRRHQGQLGWVPASTHHSPLYTYSFISFFIAFINQNE